MSQAFVTIVAPLDPAKLATAQAAIDLLGNPIAPELAAALGKTDADGRGTHFLSLHALPSFTAGRAHLVLEFSADGSEAQAIDRVATAIGGMLGPIFALARDWGDGNVAAYLKAHSITCGFGWRTAPGLNHGGSPGMSVGRIIAEAALADRCAGVLNAQGAGLSALARLEAVRAALGDEGRALPPGDAAPAFAKQGLASIIPTAALAFIRTYLWPVGLVLLAWIAASALRRARHAPDWRHALRPALHGAWHGLWSGALVLGIVTALLLGLTYWLLRRAETRDWVSERNPDRATLREIVARENHFAHNHMVSLTERKPGWVRAFTARLAFWAIATLSPKLYRPGYLGPIGTIHFARWVTVPGTRDFIFFSNYGGSWEAYLEDFITLAHIGLTGVWSNTVGFPKSANLFQQGATDGERFKRYARQSMVPTRCWYSAYPSLTTDMIRANAAVRRGLTGAMTEDEANSWLCHFGSAIRPQDTLVTPQIQSLLFGGLGFLEHAAFSLWRLPQDRALARAWLRDLQPLIGWGDGRRVRDDDRLRAVVQLGLSAPGLATLGLPPDALDSFPPAFVEGMAARARILGDSGETAPDRWWWGAEPDHVALIVYGQDAPTLAAIEAELLTAALHRGVLQSHRVEMARFDRANNYEPFGFADGGSQPVIRGTYKGLRSGDPLHLVEPGEFILGYPDNRGNLPPGPVMDPMDDPENRLPHLDPDTSFAAAGVNQQRAIGRDGSFLVVRQLEQDVAAFNSYCAETATEIAPRLGAPYWVTPDFIAAKLVGRWRNGAALVRAPYSASAKQAIIDANDFWLGAEDPEGLRCPFGAHIRRANPRDSLDPGSADQVAISNRHRIMRIGRHYAPDPGANLGLLFMCLNGDLERQFEFIQQTWINGNIVSLSCPISLKGEGDPLLGPGGGSGFTIPTRDGLVRLKPPPRFVTMRGGGYYFLPGRALLGWLAAA